MSEETSRRSAGLLIAVAVAAAVLGMVVAGLIARGCVPGPTTVPVTAEIDAGPGEAEIAARLDAAVQADEAEVRALEERNARALEALDDQQRAEYAEVRRGGRRAVARWLSDFNTALKTDAGSP